MLIEWISNIKEYPKDSNILLASAFNTVFSIINNEAKEIYSIDDNSVLIEIEQDDEGLILIYSYGRVFRITKEDEKWQVNELPRITQDDEEDLVMIRCARLTKDKKYLVSCFDEKNKILIRKLKTQQEFEIDLKGT